MPQLSPEVVAMSMPNAETFAAIGGGVGLATTAFKAVTKIERGWRGIRTRAGESHRPQDAFVARKLGAPAVVAAKMTTGYAADPFYKKRTGEPYGIVGPGLHLIIPGVESIIPVSIQNRLTPLDELEVLTDTSSQFKLHPEVRWAVRDDEESIYSNWFNVSSESELIDIVKSKCSNSLRDITDLKSADFIRNRNSIYNKLQENTQEELNEYGVELRELTFSTVTPTLGEIVRQGVRHHQANILGAIASNGADLHVAPEPAEQS